MPKVFITEKHLEDIGAALRRKGNTDRRYHPSEMADAVNAITSAEVGHKIILDDGTYFAREEGLDGFDEVTVKTAPSLIVGLVSCFEGRKGAVGGFYAPNIGVIHGKTGNSCSCFSKEIGCLERIKTAALVCCGIARLIGLDFSGGFGDAQVFSCLPRGSIGIAGMAEVEENV